MSVAICDAINRKLRAFGIVVHEAPGWQSRGRSMSTSFEGGLVHHTATGFANAVPGTSIYGLLFTVGRLGTNPLLPPLCNYAGNADGSITCGAAGVANHAGASGGKSMGPLPKTSTFNKYVLGLEVVYPGDQPMKDVQYHAAVAWGRAVADVVRGGDVECVRAHAETSVTGKWDPGYASGKTIDMTAFRWAVHEFKETTVSWSPKIIKKQGQPAIYAVTPGGYWQLNTMTDVNNFAYQWGLPFNQQNAVITEVANIDWMGPNLRPTISPVEPPPGS